MFSDFHCVDLNSNANDPVSDNEDSGDVLVLSKSMSKYTQGSDDDELADVSHLPARYKTGE